MHRPITMRFTDRQHAGRALARALDSLRRDQPIVLGLPRGGVVVAAEVAAALGAPLDVWVTRTIAVPFHRETPIGALAEGLGLVIDRRVVRTIDVSPPRLLAAIHREGVELRRRVERLRGAHPPPDVSGRTVIVVDEGVENERWMRAAARGLRKCGAWRIVLATPVAATGAIDRLRHVADEIVCVHLPWEVSAVAHWYLDFRPVSDVEVLRLLAAARAARLTRRGGGARARAGAHLA